MVLIKLAAMAAVLALSVTATNFHVNRGCIYIDKAYVCAPDSRWIQKGQGGAAGSSRSEVEAKLDSPTHCFATFTWPAYYGDIFYGADNCLYDAQVAKAAPASRRAVVDHVVRVVILAAENACCYKAFNFEQGPAVSSMEKLFRITDSKIQYEDRAEIPASSLHPATTNSCAFATRACLAVSSRMESWDNIKAPGEMHTDWEIEPNHAQRLIAKNGFRQNCKWSIS
ncbi:hypothetical protein SVAN01_10957 [Stagonosporopsis vannaccii]|nr:hypothetical protein SVAN01_10957 [Stagonosporopsis vannaccii]